MSGLDLMAGLAGICGGLNRSFRLVILLSDLVCSDIYALLLCGFCVNN
jgi:hypothetical protein